MTIIDGDPFTGWLRGRQRRILRTLFREKIHPMAERYAEGVAKVTGLPVEKVKASEPYKRYVKALS